MKVPYKFTSKEVKVWDGWDSNDKLSLVCSKASTHYNIMAEILFVICTIENKLTWVLFTIENCLQLQPTGHSPSHFDSPVRHGRDIHTYSNSHNKCHPFFLSGVLIQFLRM
jgi:hypothetical protein